MVKCLAQWHKCHDQKSNPLSAADNTRAWVRWTRPLSHHEPKYEQNIREDYFSFGNLITMLSTLKWKSHSVRKVLLIHFLVIQGEFLKIQYCFLFSIVPSNNNYTNPYLHQVSSRHPDVILYEVYPQMKFILPFRSDNWLWRIVYFGKVHCHSVKKWRRLV